MGDVKRMVPALAVVMVMVSVFFVGCLGGGSNGYTISPQGSVIEANGGKLMMNVPRRRGHEHKDHPCPGGRRQ